MKFRILTVFMLSALLLTSCFSYKNTPQTTDTTPENITETDNTSLPDDIDSTAGDTGSAENTTEAENEQQNIADEPEIPLETIAEFFEGSAFVGDSVMHGLELYSRRTKCITSPSTFLTVTSFSARHALSELSEKSYHPTYNGEKMLVEDALNLCGAKRVFVSIGLNDVLSAPNTYFEQYTEFIARIKEKNPNIRVYVFSPTRPVETPGAAKMDTATAAHYKEKICELDTRLREYCAEGYISYVDVASPLLNEKGFLSNNYTSDNYVHLTNKAYTLWTVILEAYANAEICGLPVPDSMTVVQNYLDPQPQPTTEAEAQEPSTEESAQDIDLEGEYPNVAESTDIAQNDSQPQEPTTDENATDEHSTEADSGSVSDTIADSTPDEL